MSTKKDKIGSLLGRKTAASAERNGALELLKPAQAEADPPALNDVPLPQPTFIQAQPESRLPEDPSSTTRPSSQALVHQGASLDRPVKKATFDLDLQLHTELKVFAAQQGLPMVEVVEQALREYLQKARSGQR